MSLARSVTIQLDQFSPDWEGCAIVMRTRSAHETVEFQRSVRKISAESTRIEKKLISLLPKQASWPDDERARQSLLSNLIARSDSEEVEKLSEELDEASLALMNFMIEMIKGSFVSGEVYDFDTKEKREMTKEDLGDFDMEVVQRIIALIFGDTEKKTH